MSIICSYECEWGYRYSYAARLMWTSVGMLKNITVGLRPPWQPRNWLIESKKNWHNEQTVDCFKLDPYIYWGIAVIFATHPLHINEKWPSALTLSHWYCWWAHQDLNLGPKDYESSALTNWAMGPLVFRSILFEEGLKLVAAARVTHLSQSLGFNLTDTLTRNVKLLTHFFEGMVCAHFHTEAHA